jgi:hypothetical protein
MTTDVVYVCGVPQEVMEVVKVERGPERWCFGERRRLAGTLTCRRPSLDYLVATEAWGWADPVWSYACDGCGQDRRAGFGGWYEA